MSISSYLTETNWAANLLLALCKLHTRDPWHCDEYHANAPVWLTLTKDLLIWPFLVNQTITKLPKQHCNEPYIALGISQKHQVCVMREIEDLIIALDAFTWPVQCPRHLTETSFVVSCAGSLVPQPFSHIIWECTCTSILTSIDWTNVSILLRTRLSAWVALLGWDLWL